MLSHPIRLVTSAQIAARAAQRGTPWHKMFAQIFAGLRATGDCQRVFFTSRMRVLRRPPEHARASTGSGLECPFVALGRRLLCIGGQGLAIPVEACW